MEPTAWREPESLAAGDTLSFTRTLRDYLPSNGYSLDYEIRGGAAVISFQSTPDPAGTAHVLLVPAATTALWLPAQCVMVGYAINATLATRNQIYEGSFIILPNLQGSAGDIPTQTFAQQMLVSIESQLLALANLALLETRSVDWMVKYTPLETLRQEHGYWKQVRKWEIAAENAKNGLPTGLKIKPRVNIMMPNGEAAGRALFDSPGGAFW